MHLEIENWAEKNLCEDGKMLMEEAVSSYKAGAYRAAYLMSYLAFKTSIRENILQSCNPDSDNISEACWREQIIEKLENDNTWEETLNGIITSAKANGQGVAAVFKFVNYERTKSRFDFWRGIRNSCAHARHEKITAATIEHFWDYMRDDLPEFYALGGEKYLVERLSYTYMYFASVGQDVLEELLHGILVVFKKKVKCCFEGLYERNRFCLNLNERNIDFWKTIVNSSEVKIKEAFIDFLYEHMDSFIVWYSEFPQIFESMYTRHKLFVQESLAPYLEGSYYIEGNCLWALLVEILRRDPQLIDLKKTASDYGKYRLLKQVEGLSSFEYDVLQKYNLFNLFLENAGGDYFRNSSDAHSSYYYFSEKLDMHTEECFNHIIWNLEIIEKLNSAYRELEQSMGWRTNNNAVRYGNLRKESYDRIILTHGVEIKKIVESNGNDLSEYEKINSILELGENE